MNYSNNINAQIKELKTKASEKLDTKIHEAISKSLSKAEKPYKRRITMKSNIARFATCITVLIIAAIAVVHFSGGKIDFADPAFADVIEKIYRAKNLTYTEKMITSQSDFTSRNIATNTGLMRTELSFGSVMLFDDTNGTQMTIYTAQKQCFINRKVGQKKSPRPFSRLDWIQKMHHGPAEFSHSEALDGKETDIFMIKIPYETTTIWVDSQTDLPVKIVMEYLPNTEAQVVMPSYSLSKKDFGGSASESASFMIGSGRGSGMGITDKMTVIMTDFVWDSDLDPSLFSFEPQDDWEVVENKQQDPKIDKDVLIKALSFWSEMSDNKFPDKINDLMDPALLNPMLIKKYNTGGDPEEQFKQAYNQVQTVLSGLYFTQEKLVNNDFHYAGAGITFGDADTPIAWWQNEEDDKWSVIYADLSVDEAAKEPPIE